MCQSCGTEVPGVLRESDPRPALWARFAAAALSSHVDATSRYTAQCAAAAADEMLAEYEKRFGPKKEKP